MFYNSSMKKHRSPIMKLAHLTRGQLLRLLKAAKNSKDLHAERNWLMILVGYWHGLRTGEVIQLRGTDIRDGYITIRRQKGSLLTTQKIIRHSNPLLNEFSALVKAASAAGEKRIFDIEQTQVRNIFRYYAEIAGIPKPYQHFHTLKHSLAMHQIEAGVGLQNIRQSLGHKSLSSTGMYLRATDEQASDALIAALVKGKRS